MCGDPEAQSSDERRAVVRAVSFGLLACCFGTTGTASISAAGSVGVQVAIDTQQPAHVVTGTLTMLDLSARKGMLKTDLGKPIFFEVGRADHFARLSIGDRVTVQLDDEGRTVKVIEALPAEVHEPPPQ